MDKIFHEKQEGCLCAQHCLNALLQGPYFTPVDLATLAHQMDEQERLHMAESGVDRKEYHEFLQQPSGNMDDSGFFSVQVISAALNVWNLELVPYNSQEPPALEAQKAPEEMQAYICNYREHWFTIRRLGNQWFNLNSLLSGPQLISNTYLSIYLATLQHEGYSIFVVLGGLPPCDAEKEILENPVVQVTMPKPVKQAVKSVGYRLGNSGEEDDLQKAIQLSLGQERRDTPEEKPVPVVDITGTGDIGEDVDLQRALQLSLETQQVERVQVEEEEEEEEEEDDNLRRAVLMSLESCPGTSGTSGTSGTERPAPSSTPRQSELDQSEVRAARLRYLDRAATSSGKM